MTTFIFIHGKGAQDDTLSRWRQVFTERLWDAGHHVPTASDWVEVRYDDLREKWPAYDPDPWPPTSKVPQDAFKTFRDTQALLERLAVKPPSTGAIEHANKWLSPVIRSALPAVAGVVASGVAGPAGPAAAVVVGKAMPKMDGDIRQVVISRMADVALFAADETFRRAVVHRILDCIPDGDVVIVAHSLGSVAALEAIPYLRSTTSVKLLITAGSPAAAPELREATTLAGNKVPFPSDRVGAWVNLVNVRDPVTFGGGLRDHFPMVVDHKVDDVLSLDGKAFHGINMYLEDPIVSHSLRICLPRPDPDGPLATPAADDAEVAMLLTFLLAAFVSSSEKDSTRKARTEAIIETVLTPALRETCGVTEMADSADRLGGWVAERGRLHRARALLVAAVTDPFLPFDPQESERASRHGLLRLACHLDLTSRDVSDVMSLAAAARRVAVGTKQYGPIRQKRTQTHAGSVAESSVGALSAIAALLRGDLEKLATDDLDEVEVVAETAARWAAAARLARGASDPSAATDLAAFELALVSLEEDLDSLLQLHERASHEGGRARAAVKTNRDCLRQIRKWLDETAGVDELRAAGAFD